MKSTSLLTFLLLSISCVHVNAAPLPVNKRACIAGSCSIAVSKRQSFDFGSIGDFVGGVFGGDDEDSTVDSGVDEATIDSGSDEDTTDSSSSVGDFFSGLLGSDDDADTAGVTDSGSDNNSATDDTNTTDIDASDAAESSTDSEAEEIDNTTTDDTTTEDVTTEDTTTEDVTTEDTTTEDTNTDDSSPPPPPLRLAAATCPPEINAATVSLIKEFEGFVASPEPDPIGLPTVGFGHLCKQSGCSEVPFSFPLSQTTAAQLLQTDVKTFTKCITDFVKVPLNENQFGALTAFTFNLGCGNLQTSTLLKRLNAGESPNTVAAQEMPKFNKAGGKVLAGLTRRRNAEVALFQTSSNTAAIPCN